MHGRPNGIMCLDSATVPDLNKPGLARELQNLFRVNIRKVFLHSLYFLSLVAISYGTVDFATSGFTSSPNVTGFGLIAAACILPLLPVWRLASEEMPKLAYRSLDERAAHLDVVEAVVDGRSFTVSNGSGFGRRRLRWKIPGSSISGKTPYLPATTVAGIGDGDGVWLAVDREGKIPPLFVGVVRRT